MQIVNDVSRETFSDEALCCVYCYQSIHANDDAQFIERGKASHTECAFRVSDSFFAALDAENETDNAD